jgi:Leucine-rich repeat (LRR) protein
MVPPEEDPDDPEAEDEYAAAKWVVGVGGKVTVLTPKRRLDLAGKTPFPEEAFHVVAVNLEGVKGLTDANLRCLRSCGKMESLGLYLAGPGVTDLHFLDGMTELQHLDLRETGIGDDSLRPVRALRKLKTLNLRGCANLTSAGLAHLRDLMELEYLNLGLTRVTDLKDIAGLKKLENLGFQGAQVTDEGVKELAGLTGLVALDLRETKVTGGCLMYLRALSKLRALNFDGSQAMGVGLQNLESLSQLELLGLSGTSLSDEDLVCLVPLKRLDTLNLSSTKVTDEGLKKLTALRSLTNLGLGGTRVSDRSMRELTALQQLTALDLSGDAITDVGLKELATMKQLQKLGLQGTQVTEAGVKVLRQALPKWSVSQMTIRLQLMSYNDLACCPTPFARRQGCPSCQGLSQHIALSFPRRSCKTPTKPCLARPRHTAWSSVPIWPCFWRRLLISAIARLATPLGYLARRFVAGATVGLPGTSTSTTSLAGAASPSFPLWTRRLSRPSRARLSTRPMCHSVASRWPT